MNKNTLLSPLWTAEIWEMEIGENKTVHKPKMNPRRDKAEKKEGERKCKM
jgi:hypothetical protein